MNPELESQIEVNDNAFYNLKDFAKALDFALIGEGFLNNRIMQDSAIILKANSSTGGSDLISMLVRKYNPNIRTGNIIIIVDMSILLHDQTIVVLDYIAKE